VGEEGYSPPPYEGGGQEGVNLKPLRNLPAGKFAPPLQIRGGRIL